jgi:hypothetical protein
MISPGLPWLLKWTTWGLVLVQLAQQVDRPRTGDQDQIYRIAKRAAPNFLVDFPELAGQIEQCCSTRIPGEEQDFDCVHPDLGSLEAFSSLMCLGPVGTSIAQAGRTNPLQITGIGFESAEDCRPGH